MLLDKGFVKKFVEMKWHKARSQLVSQACQTSFFSPSGVPIWLCSTVCLDIVFPSKETGMSFSLFFLFLLFADLTDFALCVWLLPPELALCLVPLQIDLEQLSCVGEICVFNFKSRTTYWHSYSWLLCFRERVDDLD